MSEKRRDNKGRVLRTGEQQRKDGRYIFYYRDKSGKQKTAYSWKLEATDRVSAGTGKRNELSLREKEKQIAKELAQELEFQGGGYTVLELVKKYINQKRGVRETTKSGYKTVINKLTADEFGARRIDTVHLSDAKEWLINLQDKGMGYSSIHNIRGVLRPAFQMAYDDDLIRKNPFDFQLATVVVNDSVTREAITRKQQRLFLEFIKDDSHFCKYYEAVYIMFHTGLRISEFVGITVGDVDFLNQKINVDHQLQRKRNMEYYIEDTKTASGRRQIPMTDEVYDCFKKIISNRKKLKIEPMVDGKMGFLYLDKNNMPMVALHWEKYFQHICEKYNNIYKVQLPKITPHVCRHTFCSNMAKSGMNPKTLQYIMGHSDIGMTLNTYTHINFDDAAEEVKRLQNEKKQAQ